MICIQKHIQRKMKKFLKHWKRLLKHRAVILISPNQDLGDGTDGLHQQVPVLFCDCGVLGQNVVQIPERKERIVKITNWNESQAQWPLVTFGGQYGCAYSHPLSTTAIQLRQKLSFRKNGRHFLEALSNQGHTNPNWGKRIVKSLKTAISNLSV